MCSRSPVACGLLFVTLAAVACSQPTAPGAPTLDLSATDPFPIDVVDASGSAFLLNGFDGTTLTGYNRQGTLTTTIDNATVFRAAALDKFLPVDPCRSFAEAYNAAAAAGDQAGVLAAITAMATNGCAARVLVDKQQPVDPCRSFRPIPGL